jgi:hypothetical protein
LRKGDRGNEGRMEKEKCRRKNTSEDPSSLKKMKGRWWSIEAMEMGWWRWGGIRGWDSSIDSFSCRVDGRISAACLIIIMTQVRKDWTTGWSKHFNTVQILWTFLTL